MFRGWGYVPRSVLALVNNIYGNRTYRTSRFIATVNAPSFAFIAAIAAKMERLSA